MLKQSLFFRSRMFFLATLLVWSANAPAHTLPISFLTLVPDEHDLHLELIVNPFELTFFSDLDANHNGYLEPMDWQGQGEKIAWRILDAVKLRVDGRLLDPAIAGLVQSYETHHLAVRAHYAVDARHSVVSVDSSLTGITSGAHLTEVSFGNGEHAQAARLDAQSHHAKFEPAEKPVVASAAEATPPKLGSVGQHELTVMLLVGCIVSVLLLCLGSTALVIRQFVVVQSRAHSPSHTE